MPPTDLVVVLPGIMGSTLRRNKRLVWAPSAGSVLGAIATFGRSVKHLQLPDDIGDDHPHDGVEPVGLMPDLHVLPGIWTPVKGYDRLLGRLRSLGYRDVSDHPQAPPGNLLPAPYDWRLSNRWNGRHLGSVVEPALERWRSQGGPYADAKLVFICHSMGGLIARWYIEQCGGADLTRKLITLGTPYRGALKALDQLANGVHPGLGAMALDLTAFGRSLPSLHQLLPEYACLEHDGTLAKTTEVAVADLATAKTVDAMQFHTALRDAEARRPLALAATHAILGISQTTPTTAQIRDGKIVPLNTYQAQDLFGDATVPLVGATRSDVPLDSNTLRRVPDKHGNLQRNRAALDEIEGILTAQPITVRAPNPVELRVEVPELLLAGQDLTLQITPPPGHRESLRVTVTDEASRLIEARVTKPGQGITTTIIDNLPPGGYSIDVTGLSPASPITPVSSDTLIWG